MSRSRKRGVFEHRGPFAEIIVKGVRVQVRQGLYSEYVPRRESLPTVRGKIDLDGTIQLKVAQRLQVSCDFDEFSEDNQLNQVLKATMLLLLGSAQVKSARRKELRQLLPFFQNVREVPRAQLRTMLEQALTMTYQRNNQNYRVLVNVCYFVLMSWLNSDQSGQFKMREFTDEQMPKLFEKFVLEYYKQEYSPRLSAAASEIKWQIDDHAPASHLEQLPGMHTDITLRDEPNQRMLIIDTKYYTQSLLRLYGKDLLKSPNFYQIYAYVKNAAEANPDYEVGGYLLYAQTQGDVQPSLRVSISGNQLGAVTLDLNQPFDRIKKQLNGIADAYFQITD
ncbi:5-methylcytosine restriction system specificity protein McrC [Lacticaseibacillus camelliae]|uniref:5-methylcytosine restriction system specificity protein McrC n=1 Tax=Lacticaseibacillus camelliae TaxID=381742 RepID=UPI0009E9F59C